MSEKGGWPLWACFALAIAGIYSLGWFVVKTMQGLWLWFGAPMLETWGF